MFDLVFEAVVGNYGHFMDEQSDFLVKGVFLVLEAFFGVPLGVRKGLFFFGRFFFVFVVLGEAGEKVVVAGVPAVVGRDVVGGVSGEEHVEGGIREEVRVV